jgi:hypothetical protein
MEEPILFQIIFFSLWALLAIIRGYYYRKNPEEKEKTPLRERLNDLSRGNKRPYLYCNFDTFLCRCLDLIHFRASMDGLG